MKKRFGKNDFFFFGIIMILLIGILVWFYILRPTSGDSVTITIDGEVYGVYSLEEEQEIPIPNKNGEISNILLISSGKAKMIEADCPDKLCMNQNSIYRNNENIVCLPNRVVVTVTSKESDEIDAIAK